MTNIIRPFTAHRPPRPKTEADLPGLRKQVANATQAFGRSVAQVIAGRALLAPERVQKERWGVCLTCDHYRSSDRRCSLCGCYTASWLVGKIELAAEQCPARPPKWLAWSGDDKKD